LRKLIYAGARREVKRITGKPLLTPDIPIRAHRLGLLLGYATFEKAVMSRPKVPEHLRALVVTKSAVMQGCEMCQDIASHEALAGGVSERQLQELHRYESSDAFDRTERLVLDLAVGMTRTPVQVSDDLFAALSERFSDGELVELVNLIAVENLRSRFNAAFGLEAAGFSEGAVCARMETDTQPTPLAVAS
jgi:AhpD family alkylhydroperoxidase